MQSVELIQKELNYLNEHFPLAPGVLPDIVALDIETAPAVGYEAVEGAALNPFTAQITLVGLFGYIGGQLVCEQYGPGDFDRLKTRLASLSEGLTAHNSKFDLKHLVHKGVLTLEAAKSLLQHDSNILAAVCVEKPSESYLDRYETQRQQLNKARKHKHRKAGPGSLKVLAPFFLGVEPFWETEDHNNQKYNLLDCLYTYFLTAVLHTKVTSINGTKCYKDLIERSRLLLQAEVEGITLDVPETKRRLQDNAAKIVELELKIREQWRPQFDQWRVLRLTEIEQRYKDMCMTYCQKHAKQYDGVWNKKYKALMTKALDKADLELNLSSPEQLKWLLRDALHYDITDLKDEEAESTGKAVLEHLSEEHPDVATLLAYRKANKLQTSFYPELLNFAKHDGKIHCNFNLTGARTGRLSSSQPNTQQIPKPMRELFIAGEGNMLVDLDMSMLEPILIAYYSDDQELTDLILSGASFHSYNAIIMFSLDCSVDEVAKLYKRERQAAKLAGLSCLYGSGAKQLMFSLTGLGFNFSFSECQRIVNRIRDVYKGVWNFKRELDSLLETGEIIYNYMGRPIQYTNKDEIFLKGFNGLIQGSGSDIVMQSAVDFCNKNPHALLRVVVHDSICVEVQEGRAKETVMALDYEMTKWDLGKLKFKTEGGYGRNWNI